MAAIMLLAVAAGLSPLMVSGLAVRPNAKFWMGIKKAGEKLGLEEADVIELSQLGFLRNRSNPDKSGKPQFSLNRTITPKQEQFVQMVHALETLPRADGTPMIGDNSTWMSALELVKSYGLEQILDMHQRGLIQARQNRDSAPSLQYAVWKNDDTANEKALTSWVGTKQLLSKYTMSEVLELASRNQIISRPHPDVSGRTQYLVRGASDGYFQTDAYPAENAVVRALAEPILDEPFGGSHLQQLQGDAGGLDDPWQQENRNKQVADETWVTGETMQQLIENTIIDLVARGLIRTKLNPANPEETLFMVPHSAVGSEAGRGDGPDVAKGQHT